MINYTMFKTLNIDKTILEKINVLATRLLGDDTSVLSHHSSITIKKGDTLIDTLSFKVESYTNTIHYYANSNARQCNTRIALILTVLYLINSIVGTHMTISIYVDKNQNPLDPAIAESLNNARHLLKELFNIDLVPTPTLNIELSYKSECKYLLLPSNLYYNAPQYNWSNHEIDFSGMSFSLAQISEFSSNNPQCLWKPLSDDLYTVYNISTKDIQNCIAIEYNFKNTKENLLKTSEILSDSEFNIIRNLIIAQKNHCISNLVTYFNTQYPTLKIEEGLVIEAMLNTDFSYKAVISIIFQLTNWTNFNEKCILNVKDESIAKVRSLIKHKYAHCGSNNENEEVSITFENTFCYSTKSDSSLLLMSSNQRYLYLLRVLHYFETGDFVCALLNTDVETESHPIRELYTKIFRNISKFELFSPFISPRFNHVKSIQLNPDNSIVVEFINKHSLVDFLNIVFNHTNET